MSMAKVNASINDKLNNIFRSFLNNNIEEGWKKGVMSEKVEEAIILWLALPSEQKESIVKSYRLKHELE